MRTWAHSHAVGLVLVAGLTMSVVAACTSEPETVEYTPSNAVQMEQEMELVGINCGLYDPDIPMNMFEECMIWEWCEAEGAPGRRYLPESDCVWALTEGFAAP